MFMNQQFHRPLPIQRAMCINRHENNAEPQSFPDPSCSLRVAEGDLRGGATAQERAEVPGTGLVPQPCCSCAGAGEEGEGERLFPVSLLA